MYRSWQESLHTAIIERKNQRQISWDRISALPQDITAKILTHMPIGDALRTSILSKKWRYCWTRMPKLVFDDELVIVSSHIEEINKYKLVNAIFHVLLLHTGPLLELHLLIYDADIYNEMDQIILHLSRSKIINKFIIEGDDAEVYKLPCSLFKLQGLEHLDLGDCKFELPSVFNGFGMLKSLRLYDVEISAKTLQRFLTNCPLLEGFTLIGEQKEFTEGDNFTFVDLFKCLPSVRVLEISEPYLEHIGACGMTQKLPTLLVHLRILVLSVCFKLQNQVSFILSILRSSPNLEKIKIQMVSYAGRTSTTLPDPQDYSGLNLDHLKELDMTRFHNYAPELEFVKLTMAKSPMLKKARIELSRYVSVDEENKMLRDLLNVPFPRASPTANFLIERPKK